MIDIRIKYNGVKVRLRGFGMKKLQNLKILQAGLESVKARLAQGIGSDDAAAPPLTKRYAIRKSRLTGRRAIRDLRLTGKFLDTFQPRYADDTQAIANSSGRDGRLKAILYRAQINFSESDQRKMAAEAERLFREQVSQVKYRLAPGGRSQFSRDGGQFKRSA